MSVRHIALLGAITLTSVWFARAEDRPPGSARAPEGALRPPAPKVEAPEPSSERSVRPGVNAEYFKDGALKKWTGILEAESREVVQKRADIVAALRLKPGSQVADIGAGTGLFTLDLASGVGPQGRVYAVDLVPDFLERIKLRAQAAQLGNVTTVLGRERSVALAPGSIDLAFMCDVYHHLEYPRAYLASLRSALRPGGELVVIDFKRLPGKTKPAIMSHVRAGQEVVTKEIEQAGFALVGEERGLLEENYLLRFVRR